MYAAIKAMHDAVDAEMRAHNLDLQTLTVPAPLPPMESFSRGVFGTQAKGYIHKCMPHECMTYSVYTISHPPAPNLCTPSRIQRVLAQAPHHGGIDQGTKENHRGVKVERNVLNKD